MPIDAQPIDDAKAETVECFGVRLIPEDHFLKHAQQTPGASLSDVVVLTKPKPQSWEVLPLTILQNVSQFERGFRCMSDTASAQ